MVVIDFLEGEPVEWLGAYVLGVGAVRDRVQVLEEIRSNLGVTWI